MRYLMLVCTDPEAEVETPPGEDLKPWLDRYDGLGWRLEGNRLRPPQDAVVVRTRQGRALTTDGPYAETKEGIAGYDLLDCPDLDAALEVAAGHPMARYGRIEVRPIDSLGLGSGPVAALPPGVSLFFQLIWDEAGGEPYEPALDNIAAWVQDSEAAGVLRGGERLAPPTSATTVRRRQGRLLVTDGPFAETKESLAGFGILACRSLAEAVEVSSKHPGARWGAVEVRAFWPIE